MCKTATTKPIYNIYQCVYCALYHKNITKYCNRHRVCYETNNYCCLNNLDIEIDKHKSCILLCDKFCNLYANITNKKITTNCLKCKNKLNIHRIKTINIYKSIIEKNNNLYKKYKLLSSLLFCSEDCYVDYIMFD